MNKKSICPQLMICQSVFYLSQKVFLLNKKASNMFKRSVFNSFYRLCRQKVAFPLEVMEFRQPASQQIGDDEACGRVVKVQMDGRNQQEIQQKKINLINKGFTMIGQRTEMLPWFPQTFDDVNLIGNTLQPQKEFTQFHAQFHDDEYLKRKGTIVEASREYCMGERIPDIEYLPAQADLWKNIFRQLRPLHKEGMCQRFCHNMDELQQQFKMSQRVPQLQHLSEYLKDKTGFIIKPASGIVDPRQFLNAFALKVFLSTQFIRNNKNPDHSPEPDVAHEVIGHIPLFADPQVAEISHIIGLLSLGASDEEIKRLGIIYQFTLQFGACKEDARVKGYGAGIASSRGQLSNLMMKGPIKPTFETLDIFRDSTADFCDQTLQSKYKVVQQFVESLSQLKRYGQQLKKPIKTVFNSVSQRIQVSPTAQVSTTRGDTVNCPECHL